jgi:hypothetical protein
MNQITGLYEHECPVGIILYENVAQFFQFLQFKSRQSWNYSSRQSLDRTVCIQKILQRLEVDGNGGSRPLPFGKCRLYHRTAEWVKSENQAIRSSSNLNDDGTHRTLRLGCGDWDHTPGIVASAFY